MSDTATLSAMRLQEIETLIADKKIAQLHVPGGMSTTNMGGASDYSKAEWKGDEHWPLFLGYPDIMHVADLPWALLEVREDAATHCTVYVRADERAVHAGKETEVPEPSNVTATSTDVPTPTDPKTVSKTK